MSRLSRLRSVVRRRTHHGDGTADSDASLLAASALFDHEWYSLLVGREMDRRAAVHHYLDGGWRGRTPHPLFDPETVADGLGLSHAEAGEALPVYLRRRAFDVATHPLFDLPLYVAQCPEARHHPGGPVGHYLEVGAPGRRRPNRWYVPSAAQARGLVDWLEADARSWARRRDDALPVWGRDDGGLAQQAVGGGRSSPGLPAEPDGIETGTTSVVMAVESGGDHLRRSVTSILAQTTRAWELLLVPVAGSPAEDEELEADDPRITVVASDARDRFEARDAGLTAARGAHVAWLVEGDRWVPTRLAALRAGLVAGQGWLHDVAHDDRPGASRPWAARATTVRRLHLGLVPDIGTVVARTELLRDVGGFGPGPPGGKELDLLLRLSDRTSPGFVPELGVLVERTRMRDREHRPVRSRPAVDLDAAPWTADRVRRDRLVAWGELAAQESDPAAVSVVVVVRDEHVSAIRLVDHLLAEVSDLRTLQVVLVDNGSPVVASAVLASVSEQHHQVDLVRTGAPESDGTAQNLALSHVRGGDVVLLDSAAAPQEGWLGELTSALADPGVVGAQPVILDANGLVLSAGEVFPPGGGLPHRLLAGFPVSDVARSDEVTVHAVSDVAFAARREDLVGVRGIDPMLRGFTASVDLCLRLAARRDGRCVVSTSSGVVVADRRGVTPHEERLSRRIFVNRWAGALPHDAVSAWRRHGFAVLGHEIRDRPFDDQRLCIASPVVLPLARAAAAPRAHVTERTPRLRWAIKNPAPEGTAGNQWGDTHFAEALGRGLEALGQEVVHDRRSSMRRQTGWTDDVVVLLRGLWPHTPQVDQVNLMWLISNVDQVSPAALVGWDRVYAASVPYADLLRARGLPATALLQATEPTRFSPDAATPDTGSDLLFIGNSRGVRRWVVDAALQRDLPLDIVGAGWDGLVPSRHVVDRFVPNERLAAAYRSAGVVLNDHWADQAADGFINNRLFDAVASGARVVSDAVPGIEDVFGAAVQVVRSADELAQVVGNPDRDAVFGSDEERRRRAARLAAAHSFEARARTMLDDALQIRADRERGD